MIDFCLDLGRGGGGGGGGGRKGGSASLDAGEDIVLAVSDTPQEQEYSESQVRFKFSFYVQTIVLFS